MDYLVVGLIVLGVLLLAGLTFVGVRRRSATPPATPAPPEVEAGPRIEVPPEVVAPSPIPVPARQGGVAAAASCWS